VFRFKPANEKTAFIELTSFKSVDSKVPSFYFGSSRRGFTIRLKRLKPRAPDFEGPQNFGSKDNFQHFLSNYVCIFLLVQRTFFYCTANKRSV